jgi:hypothetical protein
VNPKQPPKNMKTLWITHSINRSPLGYGLFLIALAVALLIMPGIVRGQVVGGDLFASNNSGGSFINGVSSIFQYTPQYVPLGPPSSIFVSNLDTPRGLAFDHDGNLYVANNHNTDNSGEIAPLEPSIFKITPDGLMSTFAAGFPSNLFLQGLAADAAGNLFVATGQNPYNNPDFLIQPAPCLQSHT